MKMNKLFNKNNLNYSNWMQQRLKDSTIVISIVISIYFVVSIFVERILPTNLFVDSQTIRSVMNNSNLKFNPNDSYSSAAAFYRIIGFNSSTPHFFESLLSTLVLIIFFRLLLNKEQFIVLSVPNMVVIVVTMFFYLCFFSVMSKDLIAFFILILTCFFYDKKRFFFVLMTGVLIYGMLFRSYWLITVPLTLMVNFAFKKNNYLLIFLGMVLYVLLVSYCYFLFTGNYISALRDQTHMVLSANTNINNLFLPINIVYDYLNSLNTMLNLFIPLDGLGSPSEIIYYLWTYYCLYLCLSVVRKKHQNKSSNLNLVAFFLSFIIVQGLFEPDMGSALRHQLVISILISNIFTNRKLLDNLILKR